MRFRNRVEPLLFPGSPKPRFIGAAVAGLVVGMPLNMAGVIGVLSLVGGVLNMMSIRGPNRMLIELPLYIAVAWGAGRMEEQHRAASNA